MTKLDAILSTLHPHPISILTYKNNSNIRRSMTTSIADTVVSVVRTIQPGHGFSAVAQHVILWRTNPLPGKSLETYNETTTVVIQRSGKHSSTTSVTFGNGVFFVVRDKELS
jgi:hypothetical protein